MITHIATQTQKATRPALILIPGSLLLQRKCACGGSPGIDGECSECRSKRLASPIHSVDQQTIQTRLTLNQPGDQYEQEADHMAEQVIRMPEPNSGQDENLQRQPINDAGAEEMHKQPMEDEEDEETLQAKVVPGQISRVTPELQMRIDSLREGGQPLPESTRAFMEPRFGHDFSHVRVHTDTRAAESARAVNALTYTVGRDVVFDIGQYRPGTNKGQKLLAHELTHVVQQQGIAPSHGMLSVGKHGSIFEREEDAATVLNSEQGDTYRPRQTTNANQISASPMLMAQLSGVRDGSNSEKSGFELPRAQKIAGFDVTKSYCSCPGKIQEWIETSQLMIKLYADCGKDPKIKTGEEIDACQDKKLEEKGIKPDLAGSTSSTGKIEIKKSSGACGSIFDKSTSIHEGIHKNYERGLKKKYREKTHAFSSHWDNPKEWVADETNAYNAEIRFYQAVAAELRSICGGPPEKRGAKK